MRNCKKIVILLLAAMICGVASADQPLKLDAKQFEAKRGATVAWKNGVLTLKIPDPEWQGGVKINPPEGQKFDFSKGRYLSCEVENLSKTDQMRLTMHITSGERGKNSTSHVDLPHREAHTGIGLNPGEKRTMRIYLPHAALFRAPEPGRNLRVLDTEHINSIEFQLLWPFEPPREYLVDCRITNLRLEGEPEYAKKITGSGTYFPFIDRYGQYIHRDWPEKIRKDSDLVEARKREAAELDKIPRPATWNQYGGWAQGPQLEATGHFRVEKYQGKWFFVDPEGRLFWSLGIDVMQPSTDAMNRKHPEWFAKDVRKGDSLPFNEWNLEKKYGKKNYRNDFYATLERRMDAWGINTIGNWANFEFIARGGKPYVIAIGDLGSATNRSLPRLKVKESDGNLKTINYYDVFDPKYDEIVGNLLAIRAKEDATIRKSLNDPMCIGYFIDNEIRHDNVANVVIKSPADQPAKQELIKDLKKKYKTIDKLNAAWETRFGSWEALAENNGDINSKGFREDNQAFYVKFLERYFETCRKGVKSSAPNRLYLGSRFVGFRQPAEVWAAAAKYCDVISVNTYMNSIYNVPRKSFHDKPVLIGEFHFGTLDRGMFMPGLAPVTTQAERADSFARYVQGALVLPEFVGCHWFQLRDQPLTGRWDGEGYQIGFIDVADTPYKELCETAREVGENMYQYRMNGKLVNEMK